ncbi:hypothetical protein CJU89_4183 [Yarrowia sp. B02]|nr:hypothetical protein CJU89_4183 [Yarrowia sp. B02]
MGNCCSMEKSEKKGPIVATPATETQEPKHNPFVISDTDLVATRSPSVAAHSLCGSNNMAAGEGFSGHPIMEEEAEDLDQQSRGRTTGAQARVPGGIPGGPNPRISIADADGSPRPAETTEGHTHHHLGMSERLSGIFHRKSVDGRPHSGLFNHPKKSMDSEYDSEPGNDMAPVMQSIVVDTGIMPGIGQGLKAQSSNPQG